LPLDKLMERSAAAPRSEESAATSAAGAEMDTVTVDGRSRAER
jgi:hypothetical protein